MAPAAEMLPTAQVCPRERLGVRLEHPAGRPATTQRSYRGSGARRAVDNAERSRKRAPSGIERAVRHARHAAIFVTGADSASGTVPSQPARPDSGDSPTRLRSGKPQLEGIFSIPDLLTSGSAGPSSAAPTATPARRHKLGLYSSNQGGGLDFVCGRGYGRQRWPECPAKTNKDR